MMWKLKSTKKEHWETCVFVDEDCIVGRKDSTLLITSDPSVSRKHAVLTVKHPEENLGDPAKRSSLFLRDEGSKYGTFKNGSRLTNEEQLSDGDLVKFGQFESEFRVHYEPLVVTSSCLDAASKNQLKNVIRKLGGHLVSEWQPACTHLVMSLVKVTIKALCCLVSLKSIVLPEYFDELLKSLKSSSSIVTPSEFIPPIGESLIDKDAVSFDLDPKRKNLFKDKAFFFLDNKQFKKLHLGIIMGGGQASVIAENKADLDLLLSENTCVIEPVKGQLVKEESKDLLKDIVNILQKKNLRMIPESDVGLAVVYASTEKFCNPSFNVGSAVLGSQRMPSQTLTEREVYAPNTEESQSRPKKKQPSIRSFLQECSSTEPKSKKQKTEAQDTLNITSFREDPEDVYEIPLSAQVKQELDDIFELPMNEDEDQDKELPSTLPVDPHQERLDEPEVQPKRVVPKDTKEVTPKKKVLSKVPKIEEKDTAVKENGFTSFNVDENDETNLPRNLITVKFASLIVRKPLLSTGNHITDSSVKNFKKFKKVSPLKRHALPIIIGGHDLVPYDKNAAILAEQNWDDEPEPIINGGVKGAFDWDSQNQ